MTSEVTVTAPPVPPASEGLRPWLGLKDFVVETASHDYLSWDFKLKRTLAGLSYRPQLWNPIWMAPLAPREIAELLAEPVDPEELFEEAVDAWDSSRKLTLVDRSLQFFTRLYLADDILTKVDRASMAHGLEVRSPFLDIELVDLARRTSVSWR